jgi:hypothetical protein
MQGRCHRKPEGREPAKTFRRFRRADEPARPVGADGPLDGLDGADVNDRLPVRLADAVDAGHGLRYSISRGAAVDSSGAGLSPRSHLGLSPGPTAALPARPVPIRRLPHTTSGVARRWSGSATPDRPDSWPAPLDGPPKEVWTIHPTGSIRSGATPGCRTYLSCCSHPCFSQKTRASPPPGPTGVSTRSQSA